MRSSVLSKVKLFSAQLDGVTSLQYGSSGARESSNLFIGVGDGQRPKGLGDGKGPAGLYSHRDYKNKGKPKKMTRSSAMGQSSTSVAKLNIPTSRTGNPIVGHAR